MSQPKHYHRSNTGGHTVHQYVEVFGRQYRGGNVMARHRSVHKNKDNEKDYENDSKKINICYNIHPKYKADTVKTVHFNASVISKPSVRGGNEFPPPKADQSKGLAPHQRRVIPLGSTDGAPSGRHGFSGFSPSDLRPRNTYHNEIVEYMKGGAICIGVPDRSQANVRGSRISSEVPGQFPELQGFSGLSPEVPDRSQANVRGSRISSEVPDLSDKVKRMSTSSPEFIPSSNGTKTRGDELADMAERMYVSNYIDDIFTRFLGPQGDLKFVETFDRVLIVDIIREARLCLNLPSRN